MQFARERRCRKQQIVYLLLVSVGNSAQTFKASVDVGQLTFKICKLLLVAELLIKAYTRVGGKSLRPFVNFTRGRTRYLFNEFGGDIS